MKINDEKLLSTVAFHFNLRPSTPAAKGISQRAADEAGITEMSNVPPPPRVSGFADSGFGGGGGGAVQGYLALIPD